MSDNLYPGKNIVNIIRVKFRSADADAGVKGSPAVRVRSVWSRFERHATGAQFLRNDVGLEGMAAHRPSNSGQARVNWQRTVDAVDEHANVDN